MEPITTTKNLISLLVFSTPGVQPWLLSAIYGPFTATAKQSFWDSLHTEADRFPGPWILIGDFNGVWASRDHSSNKRVDRDSKIMREALYNLGMLSIPSSGFYFTWSNNRQGRNRINSRMDRGVANENWWGLFPNASIKLMPQSTSDHNSQVLYCFGQHTFAKRPFRFEAAWVEDQRSY